MIKVYGDNSIGYDDGENILINLSKNDNYCKVIGRVNKININIRNDSECISNYNIGVLSLTKAQQYVIKSLGVQRGDNYSQCGDNIGVFTKENGKNYNPQIGDYLIAKINPKNSYIHELFLQNEKSINEIITFSNTLNIPECEGIMKETEITIQDSQNYYIGGIIFLLIIIGVLILKIYKPSPLKK